MKNSLLKLLCVSIGLLFSLYTNAYTTDDFIWDFEWLETDNRVEIVVGEPYQLKYTSSTNTSKIFSSEYASNWVKYSYNSYGMLVVEDTEGYIINEKGVITGLVPGTYAIKCTGLISAKSGTDKKLYITVVSEKSETESNNTLDTANEFTKKIKISLYNSSDVDYVKYKHHSSWGTFLTFKVHYNGTGNVPLCFRWASFSGSSPELMGGGALCEQDQECTVLVTGGEYIYFELYCNQSYVNYFKYNQYFTIEVLGDPDPEVNDVISKISNIGNVEYTEACKEKIDGARSAYNDLTSDQQLLVTNYETLTTAETTYATLEAEKKAADEAAAQEVIDKINAIGTVEYTDVCKTNIDAARNGYDFLTDTQKSLVTNYETLTSAESTYATLKAEAEQKAADEAAAQSVTDKINAIGTVEYTDVCKANIDAARTAYDALTDAQKALVSNYETLTTAETTYATLEAEKKAADEAAAQEVTDKIAAIGTVEYTDACKANIDAARSAYDALTADQKAIVTNYETLTSAEATYDALKAEAEQKAADEAAAQAVVDKIAAIGTVEHTDACKDNIDAARSAYDALTDAQKALVTNYDVLTAAEEAYNTAGIDGITIDALAKNGKFVKNGKLYIVKNGKLFNEGGQVIK